MAVSMAVHAKDCYFHRVLPQAFIIYGMNCYTGLSFVFFLHKKLSCQMCWLCTNWCECMTPCAKHYFYLFIFFILFYFLLKMFTLLYIIKPIVSSNPAQQTGFLFTLLPLHIKRKYHHTCLFYYFWEWKMKCEMCEWYGVLCNCLYCNVFYSCFIFNSHIEIWDVKVMTFMFIVMLCVSALFKAKSLKTFTSENWKGKWFILGIYFNLFG